MEIGRAIQLAEVPDPVEVERCIGAELYRHLESGGVGFGIELEDADDFYKEIK